MKLSAIYCQTCRTANETSETHCHSCGMRLMLVVFPNSLQYDQNQTPTFYEDHLLERMTTLERQLGQTLNKLEKAYDVIDRCLGMLEKNNQVFQAFLETVQQLNPEFSKLLNQRGKEIYENLRETETAQTKKKKLLAEIESRHDKPNAELFTQLVGKGVDFLAANDEKEAFKMLERAALLSANNIVLFNFIAENLFRLDQFAKAVKYLEKSLEFDSANANNLLMLGAITADEGETKTAESLLKKISADSGKAAVKNYICGMLAAFKENWSEAVAAFKAAQGNTESAELEYLIGCAYFQMKREKISLRHFQKAVEADGNFSDAYFMQSLVFINLKDYECAEKAKQTASELKENGAQCRAFLKKTSEIQIALPFRHFAAAAENPKILTGGAMRLTKFFKKMILSSIENK